MNLERRGRDEVEVVADRPTVVTALPLKRGARQRLAALLDARVVDIRQPVERADVVIAPSCSPQSVAALQRAYEGARVVIVELDDWEFDITLSGPVKRVLRAGAASYLLADSIDELAAKLKGGASTAAEDQGDDIGSAEVHELPSGASVDDIIAAFLRESADYAERVQEERRGTTD